VGCPSRTASGSTGVEVVKDGDRFGVHSLDIDDHSVALVDAGNDRQAKPILARAGRRGSRVRRSRPFFLTHGDREP